jgi:hypothetical protein
MGGYKSGSNGVVQGFSRGKSAIVSAKLWNNNFTAKERKCCSNSAVQAYLFVKC